MKNLAGKFFNRSQLDSGRGDYIEPSVANFSDSYNFGENHDGKTGNYRRGLMRKLKIFGVGMMGLIAVACANLNEMDFLSMGLRHRANDPKANLSQSQRNSAWSLGDLFGIAGDREYYKDSARETLLRSHQNIRKMHEITEGKNPNYYTLQNRFDNRFNTPIFFNAAKKVGQWEY